MAVLCGILNVSLLRSLKPDPLTPQNLRVGRKPGIPGVAEEERKYGQFNGIFEVL